MTDLLEWREDVLAAREAARSSDAFARHSAEGLVLLFNSMAPTELRITETGALRLMVTPSGRRPSAMDLAVVLEHFSRAVASIGAEIQDPLAERQLGPADYHRAPIFPTTIPGGPLVLTTEPGPLTLSALPSGPTTADMALSRLANVLPENGRDNAFPARLLASRLPTARAILEVARAAKRTHGLQLQLDGTPEGVVSAIDVEQANLISDLLKDTREQSKTLRLPGRLDGVRFKRREFYLEVKDRDIHGVVDETLVPMVRELLDQPVVATVERVSRITNAGVRRQTFYRLVDLASDDKLTT